ncbi:MAG: hypothetical protein QXR05_07150 [Candidatus Methanomethylicia archaeon]
MVQKLRIPQEAESLLRNFRILDINDSIVISQLTKDTVLLENMQTDCYYSVAIEGRLEGNSLSLRDAFSFIRYPAVFEVHTADMLMTIANSKVSLVRGITEPLYPRINRSLGELRGEFNVELFHVARMLSDYESFDEIIFRVEKHVVYIIAPRETYRYYFENEVEKANYEFSVRVKYLREFLQIQMNTLTMKVYDSVVEMSYSMPKASFRAVVKRW